MQRRELETLLLSCPLQDFLGVRDAAIISVLAGTGIRASGLTALNEGDLRTQLDESGRETCSLRIREKGNRERLVPLPDEAWLMVRAYLGHADIDEMDRWLPNRDRVLFVSTQNRRVPAWQYVGEHRRLSPHAVWRMLRRRGERAGISPAALHPHALRHLFGTELAEADVDQLTIGQLMGHRDPSSTKIYVHLSQSRLRRVVDKGNPLASIRTPTSDLVHVLRRKSGG